MRRIVAMIASGIAVLAVAAVAPGQTQAMEPTAESHVAMAMALAGPAAVTGITSRPRQAAYTCRRAWRCGPYACGWRQICSWAGWRPYWRSDHYQWRRHQWRRHYW